MGVKAKDLPGSANDYLRDMDRGWDKDHVYEALAAALKIEQSTLSQHFSKDVVWDSYNRGRNNWVVWTGGNDRLWNFMANNTVGALDLLKTLSSHPSIKYCGNETKPRDDGHGNNATGDYARNNQDHYPPQQYPPGYYVYEDDQCTGEDRRFYRSSRDNRWKYFGLVNEPGFTKWDPKDCDGDKWKNDKKTEDHPYGQMWQPGAVLAFG